MATGVLTVVGNAIAPGLGGVIGGAVGSFIDQNYIMPALFPPDDVKGPTIDELRLSQSNEGAPQFVAYGPSNRIPGTIIYLSDLIEVAVEEEVGGKGGGPSQTVVNYEYFVDVAVAFNRRPDGIHRYEEIIVEGKIVYDGNVDVAISSNQISATVEFVNWVFWDASGFTMGVGPGEWVVLTVASNVTLNSPNGGPDLSAIFSGNSITMSGWNVSELNGTFLVIATNFDEATGESSCIINGVPATTVSDPNVAPNNTIVINQNNPEFSPAQISEVQFYDGSQTDLDVDPVISADKGSNNTPAFTGLAYARFTRFALKPFGNRIPQNWEALMTCDVAPYTIASCISAIMDEAAAFTGVPIAYDVSLVTGNLDGYAVRGPLTTIAKLQPLLIRYDILTQERNGVIHFIPRDQLTTVVIPDAKLSAHEFGEDAPRPSESADGGGVDLPKEVVVKYRDLDNKLNVGTQRAKRLGSVTEESVLTETPTAATATDARNLAERILWTAWAKRRPHQIQLPPSEMKLAENDLVQFNGVGGDSVLFLAERVDMGSNGLLIVEGLEEVTANVTFDAPAEATLGGPSAPLQLPYFVVYEVLDIAPLQDAQAVVPVLYIGATAEQSNQSWKGATVFKSPDGGNSFINNGALPIQISLGCTTTELGEADPGVWDYGNTVDVMMAAGATLTSRDELEVLGGSNRMLIAGEVIGFVNATLQGDGTYRLSKLLRGLRATEGAIPEHSATDRVVYLNSAGLTDFVQQESSINVTQVYKVAAPGADLDDLTARSFTFSGNSLRPFEPWNIKAERQSDNDWEIDFSRRTRRNVRIFAENKSAPLDSPETYEIDILDGSNNVLGTHTVTGDGSESYTFDYTSALQTADGLTPPVAQLRFHIHQVSSVVGRSRRVTTHVFNA